MQENKRNTFLGLVGLLLILGVLYFSFNWFLKLFSILKTYDAVIVVAIITGLVTITTTTFKVIFDIKQTRLQYLTQKRETAYYHFVEMIYKINQSDIRCLLIDGQQRLTSVTLLLIALAEYAREHCASSSSERTVARTASAWTPARTAATLATTRRTASPPASSSTATAATSSVPCARNSASKARRFRSP